MREVDYFEMVQKSTREEFVERCPFPFFVGADVLKRPQGASRTIVQPRAEELERMAEWAQQQERAPAPRPLVLAIRKVQPLFPSLISVGRTSNNDVVISDVQVSKVHAFVKVTDGQHEITDAGSRNGTWVGDERLAPKGKPRVLLTGERLRFGTLEFVFFEAAVCWQRVRSWKR
jgi:FHA domain